MWFLFAALSAVFYSALWVLGRMSRGMPSSVVTAMQFVYGPALLFLSSRTVDFPWEESWWWLYLILPFCIIPFAAWMMTFALHRTEVTVLKPLFGLSGIATLITASLFFDEQVTPLGVVGIALITVGLLCLYHGRWKVWRTIGPWLALCGAIVFGTNAAIVAAVLDKFPHVLALSGMVITGHLIFCGLIAAPHARSVRWTQRSVLIVLGLGVAMFVQDLSTLIAFTLGPSSYVIAVKRTSMLLTAVVGHVWLREREQSLKQLLLASGLVVIGVVMLTLG